MNQIENFEELRLVFEKQTTIPFKIVGISPKGFYAKVFAFKAFVSFNHFPFKYPSKESWQAIFPFLKNKLFFAKIESLEEDYIVLNADIPQFKKIELYIDSSYQGIIIEKTDKFLTIELGHSFDWKYGSIKGELHRSMRDSLCLFKVLELGDPITTSIHQISDQIESHELKGCIDYEDWQKGEISALKNQLVTVDIVCVGSKRIFIVNGKHRGNLLKDPEYYKTSKHKFEIKELFRNLEHGAQIKCIVLDVVFESKTLDLRWVFNGEKYDFETADNSNSNNLK